jgi:hypothetical protein
MPLIGAAMMLWMLDVSQARCYPEGSRADLKKGEKIKKRRIYLKTLTIYI